jgi:hypothetical protein
LWKSRGAFLDSKRKENSPKPDLMSEKRFQLPLCGVILSEGDLWGVGEKPVLLRPKDLERYGLPEATINDMVYRASETQDPLPFLKVGRKTLIPRVALEAWILRQAHVREVENDKTAN